MWIRFNKELRRALLRASDETGGARRVNTQDLLRAIEAENDVVTRVLAHAGASPSAGGNPSGSPDRGASAHMELNDAPLGEAEPALTPEARASMERAYQLAVELDDWYIGPEHLLLALIQEPEKSAAGREISERGVTWEAAGRALVMVQAQRLRAPRNVHAPELRARRAKRRIRGGAASVKRLAYGLTQYRQPYMPYLLFRRRTMDSPFGFYKRLRRQPVYWDSYLQHWIVTGYDDVVAALAEPKLSQRVFAPSVWAADDHLPFVQREFRSLHDGLDLQMLFQDAPEQTRQRALVAKRFTPRVIAQMREQMQTLTDELLDAVEPAGRMDVIADLAIPYPITIIVRMLGLPVSERVQFKKWSVDYFSHLTFESTLEQDLAVHHSYRAATEYFRPFILERRNAPGEDLISLLSRPDENGELLPDDEIVSACLMLLATGHENTTRMIGGGVNALLRHPEQLQLLRADPALIGSAVEEMLRYDSPVQWTLRHLRDDLDWRGQSMKKGQRVQIGIGPANRDPAQFPDPDRFDIARARNRHVAFGYGSHFCLGAALGRLETQIVIGGLVARFPALRQDRPAEWVQDGIAFRGPKTLQVRWD